MNTRPTQQEMLETALAEARQRYAAAVTAKQMMLELAEIVRLENALIALDR